MKHHDHRHRKPVKHTEDLVAIGAAIDSELVLHHRDVELVQRRRRLCLRSIRPWDEVRNDARVGGCFGPVDYPDDSASATGRHKLGAKRRRKRGQTTLRRGIRNEESDGHGHRD